MVAVVLGQGADATGKDRGPRTSLANASARFTVPEPPYVILRRGPPEAVVVDNRALRIYTSAIPATNRLVTLMHDPQYRLSVAWQNVGYNQPTQPGFYLGDGMTSRAP